MIVLIGGTASGKSSVLDALTNNWGYERIVTYTTRRPREGEKNDVDYHFIDGLKFNELKDSGFFIETTEYEVATGEIWQYGTASEDLAPNKIIILNPYGLKRLREENALDIVTFYLFASPDVIRDRLERRGDAPDEAARRMKADKKDFEDITEYVDFGINTSRYLSVNEIANLIHNLYESRRS